jgi:hypothetical protein
VEETHDGKVEVVLGKGESQFDILRLARVEACNHDMDTEDLIHRLQSWHRCCGVDIIAAETDTIELSLERLPVDPWAFANEVYEFCPDIVDQGVGSVDVLRAKHQGLQVYLPLVGLSCAAGTILLQTMNGYVQRSDRRFR